MEKIGITIKLLKRVKPVGMEQYVKLHNLPIRLRSCKDDDLNRYYTEIPVLPGRYPQTYNLEIARLKEATEWKFGFQNIEPGDLLIGFVSDENSDFETAILKTR